MSRSMPGILCALLLGALLTAAAQAAPPRHVAVPKGDETKPGTLDFPRFEAARTPFDCAGRDTLFLAAGMVDTLRGDTSDGQALLDGYACSIWPEAGREHIYRLELTETVEFWAGLREVDPGLDLDLFLLDGCDSDQCLVAANIEFSAQLDPGTYWLAVDGFGSADTTNVGPYALALETRLPGLPPAACATDSLLVCGVGTVGSRGNLFGAENLISSYDCSANLLRGGEVWYAVTLQPGQSLSVESAALADSLDTALWLFADCGPAAVCLAAADDGLAGENEVLAWDNPDPVDVTVYLGLDCARQPLSEAQGVYLLAFTCGDDVPVTPTSFGGLRALYR